MTPLKTEANPNIQVGPLRWGRPDIVPADTDANDCVNVPNIPNIANRT